MVERSPRGREIVAAARDPGDRGRRGVDDAPALAERIGIRAPSVYKHFPDKAAVEAALIDGGFVELAEAFRRGMREQGATLRALATTYRGFARASPDRYRLMTAGPLPREHLQAGVEAAAAAPLLQVTGDPDLARAVGAFAHGMTILELDGRFPPEADLGAAWETGITVFEAAVRTRGEEPAR